MTTANTQLRLWTGQRLHVICLALLLVLVYLMWTTLGRPFPLAFWCAIACPVIHQVYVWLTWRLELQNSLISKSIGFHGFLIIFFLLFATRFISLFILAWIDKGSLGLNSALMVTLTVLLAVPGIYAMYSVRRYFGMARAAGADHFDTRYRSMPLVKQGIFRYTSNGMYLYAFLLFWAIATGFNSSTALTVAAFSHLYIWAHYFATEKPDMDFLYNADQTSQPTVIAND